jgi:hypothetical protein
VAQGQAVFGIFANTEDAKHTVKLLYSAGFREVDLSVLSSETQGNKDLAIEKTTKAPEGAVAGVSAGAILGGALGLLTGMGALMIPGAGPFLAAGPLMSLLSGLGIGGTVGGLAGALIGAGVPEFEAKRYEGRIQGGHVLLSVHCDNKEWADKAAEILEGGGGEDISRTKEAEANFDASERPHPKRDSPYEYEPEFRKNFDTFHSELGVYEKFAAVYQWGYEMAKDPRYREETFEKAEPDLKQTFCLMNPSADWTKISPLVLYGWEQAGGRIETRFAII